jgi:hypothetical protein
VLRMNCSDMVALLCEKVTSASIGRRDAREMRRLLDV